ncbi:MAG: FecR domain-containing protein [Chitinispirillaceae bacterium]|nr:FecR domain-containing protein [Chitinispirillaceae bacterium]
MNKEILIKYLSNSCSEDEFEDLARWVENKVATDVDKHWSSDIWYTFEPDEGSKDEVKYEALLNKIHHEINLRQQAIKDSRIIRLTTFAKWMSRVAAILFLPLLGVIFYLLSNTTLQNRYLTGSAVDSLEVIAPVGSRTTVQLADGTEVHLNYGSRIKYPRNFAGKSREITLSGEAYFDVSHNPRKPFVVKTGNMNIKALGTRFNVQAYPADNMIATTLVDGRVVIEKTIPGKALTPLGTLAPGQHMEYDKTTGKISSSMVNVDKYIAWKEGRMVFDNTPIEEVTRQLGRKFNVDIEVAENIRYLTYTVTFIDDPLYLILDLMTETTPISYCRYPRQKLPDGSFSKQKIRIEKR